MAEDASAFFHLTPLGTDHELLGQTDQTITANASAPTVRSPGGVVVVHVEISVMKLQAGSYAVWSGLYSPVTHIHVSVEEGAGVFCEDLARL